MSFGDGTFNRSVGCKSMIEGTMFNKTDSKYSILITDRIIGAYTNYTIVVIPLNGFGWGNESRKSVTTGQNGMLLWSCRFDK